MVAGAFVVVVGAAVLVCMVAGAAVVVAGAFVVVVGAAVVVCTLQQQFRNTDLFRALYSRTSSYSARGVNTETGQCQSPCQTDQSTGKHAAKQEQHQTHAKEVVQLLQPAPRRRG